jgi:hypothetical protein
MRRISLGFVAAALAFTGLTGGISTPADAGGPGEVVVKISKHEDGPFEDFLGKINIPSGVKKTVFFKVKTVSVGTLAIQLNGTENTVDGFRIKWFRGAKNVTDKIGTTDGLHVDIEPGEVKRYEARIRHLASQAESESGFCLELFAEAPTDNDVASIGVNVFCA